MNQIKSVSFTEYVVVPLGQPSHESFDIIMESPPNEQRYCTALLSKIVALAQPQFSHFVTYQTTQVENPLEWLDNFEELLCKNEKTFAQKQLLFRYQRICNCIESKRIELQLLTKQEKNLPVKRFINAESEERYFSFYEIKKQVHSLEDDNDKILLLTKEKHEYRQSNIEFINQKLPLFDKQCSKEIEQIYEMQNIKSTIDKLKPLDYNSTSTVTKLQFNCNVNQFVAIFYQMSKELLIEGKPFIEGNINDIAMMIVNTFVDKEGKEISLSSVQTILKPSREDKRPNQDKRIDISKLLS